MKGGRKGREPAGEWEVDRRWAKKVAGLRCAGAINGGTSVRMMASEMSRKVQMWGLDLTCEKEAVLRGAVV